MGNHKNDISEDDAKKDLTKLSNAVDLILSTERERGLLDRLKSEEGSPDTRAAGIQALVKPIVAGMLGNFERMVQNIITTKAILATVGTPLYSILKANLCSDVSSHHIADYQRFTIRLDCRVVAQTTTTSNEPWATLAKIASASDKKWLTAAIEHLAKHPGWIETGSIRPLGFYLAKHGIRTERELRMHLGFKVPERTFSTAVAGVSKQFANVPEDRAATMTEQLVERAPAICTSIVADIDRYVERVKNFSAMSADQKTKAQGALARASERIGGGQPMPRQPQNDASRPVPITLQSIQESLSKLSPAERDKLLAEFQPAPLGEPTWEAWIEKLGRFLATDDKDEKNKRVQAAMRLLAGAGGAATLSIIAHQIEEIFPKLSNQERNTYLEELRKISKQIANTDKDTNQKAAEVATELFPFAKA
jgi:hypothetical protein